MAGLRGPDWARIALLRRVTAALLGVLAGYWADRQFGTLPVFVVIGFLIGAGAGTVMIYRLVSRFLKTMD